jgi:hypothetical protein
MIRSFHVCLPTSTPPPRIEPPGHGIIHMICKNYSEYSNTLQKVFFGFRNKRGAASDAQFL